MFRLIPLLMVIVGSICLKMVLSNDERRQDRTKDTEVSLQHAKATLARNTKLMKHADSLKARISKLSYGSSSYQNYLIVHSTSADSVSARVSRMRRAGYVLNGSLQTERNQAGGFEYIQAMTQAIR